MKYYKGVWKVGLATRVHGGKKYSNNREKPTERRMIEIGLDEYYRISHLEKRLKTNYHH